MPVYAYHCRNCENDFEVKQSFHDDPLANCVVCDAEGSVFRVIQPAGVVFKGSGFYVTDTKGTKNSTSTSAKSENGSQSSGNSGSSNETVVTPTEKAS